MLPLAFDVPYFWTAGRCLVLLTPILLDSLESWVLLTTILLDEELIILLLTAVLLDYL